MVKCGAVVISIRCISAGKYRAFPFNARQPHQNSCPVIWFKTETSGADVFLPVSLARDFLGPKLKFSGACPGPSYLAVFCIVVLPNFHSFFGQD
jgi:hypothetical protein